MERAALIRSQNLSIRGMRNQAQNAYPNAPSYRARLMRLCRASDVDFQHAIQALHQGGNVNVVVSAVPPPTVGGAPRGNLNAKGKVRIPGRTLEKMRGSWRALSLEEKRAFFEEIRGELDAD